MVYFIHLDQNYNILDLIFKIIILYYIMTHLNEDNNFIDDHVKDNIRKGINIIQNTLEGSKEGWITYYTGYLYKDILDNFPGRTNKKIFKSYKKFTTNNILTFAQKKFDEDGYDYFVQKRVRIK